MTKEVLSFTTKYDSFLVPTAAAVATALAIVALSGSSTKIKQTIMQPLTALSGKLHVAMLVFRNKNKDDPEAATVVSGLFCYPVKSLRRTELTKSTLGRRGFLNDRSYMLVTPSGVSLTSTSTHRFVTQRKYPIIARIDVSLEKDTLRLSSDANNTTISCPSLPNPKAPIYSARVWGKTFQVQDMGDEIASFFQAIVALDKNYDTMDGQARLVRQCDNDTNTPSIIPWASRTLVGRDPSVSLADGFPQLLTSQASLDALNERLIAKGKEPLPMSRFRANIVIQGVSPFAEDRMKVIRIGPSAIFYVINGCPRCQQSCTDQELGIVGDEPLNTLKDFRQMNPEHPDLVYFGVNLIPAASAEGYTVSVGDTVTVLEWGTPAWSEG